MAGFVGYQCPGTGMMFRWKTVSHYQYSVQASFVRASNETITGSKRDMDQ